MLKISPLAPARFPKIPEIPGVTLTGQHVGLKADPKVKDMVKDRVKAGLVQQCSMLVTRWPTGRTVLARMSCSGLLLEGPSRSGLRP